MATFERNADGTIEAAFESEEAMVLGRLVEEMRLVLTDDSADPVTQRLFPDAYEDPEDQSSYESLVGDQLRTEKLRILDRVGETLAQQPVALEGDDLDIWLATLNDMRLALGTRLSVTEDVMGSELDPENPNAPALSVLHWLGWVQESLLRHLRA